MDRFREPDDLPDVDPLPTIEEEASAQADSFADWIASKCMGHNDVELYLHDDTAGLQRWADDAAIPELVAGLLYPRADVVLVAANELRCRWIEQYQDDRKSGAARQAAFTAQLLARLEKQA